MSITKKQIAAEFRKALPILWDGKPRSRGDVNVEFKEEFICMCLQHRDGKWIPSDFMSPAALAAKKVIHDRIAPFTTVETWLYENHPSLKPSVGKRVPYQKMQAYRKAWLKSLIKEFSK